MKRKNRPPFSGRAGRDFEPNGRNFDDFDRDREFDRERDRVDDYPTPDRRTPKSSEKAGLLGEKNSVFNATSLAILAGVFILGIGVGLGFNSVSGSDAGKIVTQFDLDKQAPNADFCVQYGASAITMDTRVYVTLNPLNVYVSQPTTRPGCVLRTNNWALLEQRGVIKGDQVRECKNRMNTFGFVGKLEETPQVDCVYQNDAAKNLFLNQPGTVGAPPPENQKF